MPVMSNRREVWRRGKMLASADRKVHSIPID